MINFKDVNHLFLFYFNLYRCMSGMHMEMQNRRLIPGSSLKMLGSIVHTQAGYLFSQTVVTLTYTELFR